MHTYLTTKKNVFESALAQLQKEFAGLRTGRATPALVEDLTVNAYGSAMEIKGLASISIPDPRTLVIEPWDKGLIQNIEKGIRDAGIGLNPVVDGHVVRVVVPQMTEETRKQMVKVMKELMEEARIRLRGAREDVREEILKKEKAKEVSEDEKFKLFDELDKLTKGFTDEVGEMGKRKEEEIMTV
ncbi:ribosome recycling factor [Candidatus Parcubacteria bacterium]|nr:ribosome recycling factor [Candidatus Parcubacteria bacterium]